MQMLVQTNLGMFLSVRVSMAVAIGALVYSSEIFRKCHVLSLIKTTMESYTLTL